MKILVVTEDHRLDMFIIKPVFEALFEDLHPLVVFDQTTQGSEEALDPQHLSSVIRENPMIDVFILVIDRDCDRRGHQARAAAAEGTHPPNLLACLAIEEVETWLCALYKDHLQKASGVAWRDVRSHCDPKEAFAEPLLRQIGVDGPGKGRKRAMRELRLKSLVSLCPELKELRERIDRLLDGTSSR